MNESRQPLGGSRRPTSTSRGLRLLLAGGIVAAIATGFLVRSIFNASLDAPSAVEDVRAGETPTESVAPEPVVAPTSGWQPGVGTEQASIEPPPQVNATDNAWLADVAIAPEEPPLMPSDMAVPESGMVSIASPARSVARARASAARGRTFTNDDLEEMREGAEPPPLPSPIGQP